MEDNKIRFSINKKDYEFNNCEEALNYFLEENDYFSMDDEEISGQMLCAIKETLKELDTEKSYREFEFDLFFKETHDYGKPLLLQTLLVNYVYEGRWKYSCWSLKSIVY